MTDWGPWEAVRQHVRLQLIALAEELSGRYPVNWSQVADRQSQAYPFSATLCISKTAEPAEDVIVSVAAWIDGSTLHLASDVGSQDGEIFADGPALEVAILGAEGVPHMAVGPWLDALDLFLAEVAVEEVVRQLSLPRG